jgi:hypothetical protein
MTIKSLTGVYLSAGYTLKATYGGTAASGTLTA